MRKSNKKFSVAYPEEREGKIKDANKKLKSQVKNLQKRIRQLESDNKTIERAYSKSCDFIQDKFSDKSLNEVLKTVKTYKHKETEKGRKKVLKKEEAFKDFVSNNCPECGIINGDGYIIVKTMKFKTESCVCGYRKKTETGEGIKRS